MKKIVLSLFSLLFCFAHISAQTIPNNRITDWSLAGLQKDIPDYSANTIKINDYGGIADGITSNNAILDSIFSILNGQKTVILLDTGTYIFTKTISLPPNIILRGQGAENTQLKFIAPVSGDLIEIKGTIDTQRIHVMSNGRKNQKTLILQNGHTIQKDDIIRLTINDSDLVVSDWALRTVGQIIKVVSVSGDTIHLKSPLRLAFDTTQTPYIQKINANSNTGIECLKILRGKNDNFQSHNIHFQFANDCWVKGIESDSANFAHIALYNSTNIEIRNNYFHDAYEYGGGGKAYGVLIQYTSGECLVENNIFNHLRHSMILQAGANGNVFGYNYSLNPYWSETGLPSNSAGDLVLHGNYVFANLFEGNIGAQIVIDDSHGKNGPYNTFFRNRLTLFGIFMNNNPATDSQNVVGNEVTEASGLYGQYLLFGNGHFLHGNNIKGNIKPDNTGQLPDSSYYLKSKPVFLDTIQFPVIGTPNAFKSGENKAKLNFDNGIFSYCYADTLTPSTPGKIEGNPSSNTIRLYPNPTSGILYLDSQESIISIEIMNVQGRILIQKTQQNKGIQQMDLSSLNEGVYFIRVSSKTNVQSFKVLKLQRD